VARSLKLTAQGLALAAVAALLALLIWKLADQNRDTAAARITKGLSGPAPTFELQRLDGKGTLDLASLRGKGVVINFAASWCGPCKREAPALEAASREYRGEGLVVVGAPRPVREEALQQRLDRAQGLERQGHEGVDGEVLEGGPDQVALHDQAAGIVCARSMRGH
jgi:thiol-disulfide isomerase/thioredoxin